MSEKKFPMVYFKICSYCKHLVVGLHRDGYNEGCGLVKNKEGKFAHIAYPHDVERLKNLGMDVFNFEDLNVKSYVKYSFFKGVYIMGGGDHLTNSAKAGGFLGAGLFLTNDDLKIFASKVSF